MAVVCPIVEETMCFKTNKNINIGCHEKKPSNCATLYNHKQILTNVNRMGPNAFQKSHETREETSAHSNDTNQLLSHNAFYTVP